MNRDLLNILSNSNKDIDNQKLMDYLSGDLSDQDKRAVEEWMVDNEFESEAMDGLEHFSRKKNLQAYVDTLNKDLNKYIEQKKKRRKQYKLTDFPWIYVAILLVLAIIVLAYFVINRLQQQ